MVAADRTTKAEGMTRLSRALVLLVAAVGATGCAGVEEASAPAATPAAPTAQAVTSTTAQPLTGQLVLNPVTWTDVESTTGQQESRDGRMVGQLTIETGGQTRSGTVTLSASTSVAGTSAPPSAHHAWGEAEAELDGAACSGAYGWSYVNLPPASGGSLHLRCDDGSMLAGALNVATIEPSPSGGTWTFTVDIDSGMYQPASS